MLPLLTRASAVITLEDSCLAGGFGSAILELCEAHQLRPNLRRLGVPDRWIPHATMAAQHRSCGLSVDGVLAAYRQLAGEARQFSAV